MAKLRPAPEAIPLQDAAVILQVSDKTLRRWWKSGRLELVRVGPKLLRMPKDVLVRLRRQQFEEGRVQPTCAPRDDRRQQDVADLVDAWREDEDRTRDVRFLPIPR